MSELLLLLRLFLLVTEDGSLDKDAASEFFRLLFLLLLPSLIVIIFVVVVIFFVGDAIVFTVVIFVPCGGMGLSRAMIVVVEPRLLSPEMARGGRLRGRGAVDAAAAATPSAFAFSYGRGGAGFESFFERVFGDGISGAPEGPSQPIRDAGNVRQ